MISNFFMLINFFKLFMISVFLGFILINSKLVHAEVVGDIEAGKNKISMCVGCHGIAEYKTAFPKTYRVPKIAGQRSEYIISALKAYRSEQRSHPSMRAVAGSMTDQDIADVATFYSTIKQ
jgi:cytochrome c553